MKVTNLEKTITKPFDNKVVLKKRDTNFELLRIISMIMIICLHFNGNGKLLNPADGMKKSRTAETVRLFSS